MRARPLHIVVTTGDADGIGLEVTLKALLKTKAIARTRFTVFRSTTRAPKYIEALQTRVQRRLGSRLELTASASNPANWVEAATRLCLAGDADGLVTAPLSKETIQASGRSEVGHTEILKKLSGTKTVHMAFLGAKFNVLLAGGHVSLKNATAKLSQKQLLAAVTAAHQLGEQLGLTKKSRPIALVGLNPHAGENGLIGDEEIRLYRPVLSLAKRRGWHVVGPLVPDAAFLKENWARYSFFVSPYHDQGLIPFKMIHGHDGGVHLSFGLPFIRTSVDHGTAKDIFGQNRAHAGSMQDALTWAIRLARKVHYGV